MKKKLIFNLPAILFAIVIVLIASYTIGMSIEKWSEKIDEEQTNEMLEYHSQDGAFVQEIDGVIRIKK